MEKLFTFYFSLFLGKKFHNWYAEISFYPLLFSFLAHAQKEEKLLSRTEIYIFCLSVLLTLSIHWLDRLFPIHYWVFHLMTQVNTSWHSGLVSTKGLIWISKNQPTTQVFPCYSRMIGGCSTVVDWFLHSGYRLCKVFTRNKYTKSEQIHVNVMNKRLNNFWLL